jgi:hypothetical protein
MAWGWCAPWPGAAPQYGPPDAVCVGPARAAHCPTAMRRSQRLPRREPQSSLSIVRRDRSDECQEHQPGSMASTRFVPAASAPAGPSWPLERETPPIAGLPPRADAGARTPDPFITKCLERVGARRGIAAGIGGSGSSSGGRRYARFPAVSRGFWPPDGGPWPNPSAPPPASLRQAGYARRHARRAQLPPPARGR